MMHRLKYPQKFALISFIFMVPLGLTMYFLVSEIHSRIDFAEREKLGNQYLRPLQKFSLSVLQLQPKISERNTAKTAESTQLQAQVNQAFTAVESAEQNLGTQLNTPEQFQALKSTLEAFNRSTGRIKTINLLQLQANIDRLRSQIGDQSNLILDPDLDTYYLMDATLLKLPEMQKILAELQLLGQEIGSQQREITPTERYRLTSLLGNLSAYNRKLHDNMQVAFKNNHSKTLQPKLADSLDALTQANTELVRSLEQAFLRNLTPSEAAFSQIPQIFSQSISLWDHSLNELDDLLDRRIQGFEQRQRWLVGFVIAVLAIALYLFMAFYRAVMETVSRLSAASHRMIDGNFTETVQLESRDELADVVRSFNTIADALRETEAKYRSIVENAVEGIFQTSIAGYYLTANSMLAKLYGYESPTDLVANLTNIEQQLYVDPNRRSEFVRLMQEQEQISGFESQIYRRDGSIIWISESARALRDRMGAIVAYEGTVEDITRRKHAEEAVAQLTRRLQDENLRMSAELAVTHRLQQMILPRPEELEQIAGLEVAGFMEPAAEVGGDYYDVVQQNGCVRIGIGDVTGHGLESGVVMIMAQTAVRTLIANGETDPVKLLNAVNRIIYDNTRRMQAHKNMTLVLLEYEAGVLRLTGQHEDVLIVRRNGEVEPIDTFELGFPLGIESDISAFVAETEVRLETGDVTVLYTDGITEAMNARNQQYGVERMHRVIQEYRARSAVQIRQAVIEDVRRHIGTQKVFDDITLLVLKQR